MKATAVPVGTFWLHRERDFGINEGCIKDCFKTAPLHSASNYTKAYKPSAHAL